MKFEVYDAFLKENEENVTSWLPPDCRDLNVPTLRKLYEIQKIYPYLSPGTVGLLATRNFLSHANVKSLKSEYAPTPKHTSLIIEKAAKNNIVLMTSKILEDARDWAIFHLFRAALIDDQIWRFAIATDGRSYVILILKNKERLERTFNVRDPKKKELCIVEQLLKELLTIVGYDVKIEKYFVDSTVVEKVSNKTY